ncbi:MAG: response regulator transcription factor, partial [Anaerolineae bacterium]|nr:response regulator transcription factor [Anaerolineae bacterium]
MIGQTNLKVLILDTDFYARQAINSYLAWDRRTRVVHLADTMDSVLAYVERSPRAEWPDVVLLDALAADSPEALAALVKHIEDTIPDVMTLVLDRRLNMDTLRAVVEADVNGYLLRNEIRIRIAWAIVWALQHDFVVTASVKDALQNEFKGRLFRAEMVPDRRQYPELTDRIRQALQLCVVEGMSAELAADEMGISPHTVRSYIKEGYRILEAY